MASSVLGWGFGSGSPDQAGVGFEGGGPSQDTTVFAQLVAQLLLVVPSHFIQGTTCPRIPLSFYDGRLLRFKVQGVCVWTTLEYIHSNLIIQ